MKTLERLESVIESLSKMNRLKPLNTLNDQELKELMQTLGLSKTRIDLITVKTKLGKIAKILSPDH